MGPKPELESDYVYLDRSGRAWSGQVRDFLEGAFAHLTPDHQKGLAARLRTEGYGSASFELIVHELLRCRRCGISVEPPKQGTTKHPDFLVTSGSLSFYVEAVLATEPKPDEVAAFTRLAALQDVLNTMESREFFVEIAVDAFGPDQPKAKDIRNFLTLKLATLDPDDESIWVDDEGEYTPPAWAWQDRGWSLVFRPHPKREDARGKPNVRPIGAVARGVRRLNTAEAIRDALLPAVRRRRQRAVTPCRRGRLHERPVW